MGEVAHLPVSQKNAQPDYLPARMLNEWVYCPRLGYLEWVQSEFADNVFTEDGRFQHRRVDAGGGELSEPEDDQEPKVVRSVLLSSEKHKIIAKIDLLEVDGVKAVPVDYKRGKKPSVPGGVYDPERMQIVAQGLILRDNGFECDHGVIYFAGSKERVEVPIESWNVERTLRDIAEFRQTAASGNIPPPLEDSPKCIGCSLVGICMPDETTVLIEPERLGRTAPRRLVPARDDALPVYVQAQGAYVSKSGETLVIKEKGNKIAEAKLFETSQLVIMGNAQVTTQTVSELLRRGIPIIYTSWGGWYYGMTLGSMHKNVEMRLHQYRAATDDKRCLELAKRFVSTKIRNCRTLLRRNAPGVEKKALTALQRSAQAANEAEDLQELLGIEGAAARTYFESFPMMLRGNPMGERFFFHGRNRRPPRDPVNAMLSFAYALLAKDLVVALTAVGFDPHLGFFHQPRYGRPSLALDLMEEFRPIVGDSTVVGAINNGVISAGDFISGPAGTAMKPGARKALIAAYERRMDQLIRHPVFGYQVSYRRVLEVQARLLGRHLSGEIDSYPQFLTR